MLWPRARHVGLRLLVAMLATAAVLLLSMRAYVAYEFHRATSMLKEASRVQVGDAEATVLPLVKRYGGFKWSPDSLGAKEDWLDKEEYDYQKELISDYSYELGASPFGLTSSGMGQGQHRITQAIRTAMNKTPSQLRTVLGMRDWGAEIVMTIRGSRVQSVSAIVLVEGRTNWLGHEWSFANAMPERRIRTRVFVVRSVALEMPSNGGALIQNIFTPQASAEEVQVARKFNSSCLTSLRGCDGFCDFIPGIVEYLKQHPAAAGNIIPPKCP